MKHVRILELLSHLLFAQWMGYSTGSLLPFSEKGSCKIGDEVAASLLGCMQFCQSETSVRIDQSGRSQDPRE